MEFVMLWSVLANLTFQMWIPVKTQTLNNKTNVRIDIFNVKVLHESFS